MTEFSEDQKRYLKYQIYHHRYDDPWISNKKIAKLVHRSVTTVDRYAQQAEKKGIIVNPKLRLVYPYRKAALLLFEDKWAAFNRLQAYINISYLSVFQGDWDIMAVYDGQLDFSHIPGYEQKIADGLRGAIFTPKVRYVSWKRSFAEVDDLLSKEEIKESNSDFGIQYPDWDEEEWKLFYYFESSLRKKFSIFRKQYSIRWKKYQKWKNSLGKYCTVMMQYYPEGRSAYEDLTLCFKTLYGEYIIELVSRFPTSSIFCMIGEYFSVNMSIPRDYSRQKRIHSIISKLIDKNIITDYMDGYAIGHYVPTDSEG
jgi:hypothetical protein